MTDKDSNPNKSGRTTRKPATVTLDDGTVIDAAHHITTENNRILHLYIDSRDGGIDVSVPLTRDNTAWARTPAGERALDIDNNVGDASGGEEEFVADGGRDIPPCECGADLVRTAELTTEYAPAETARRPRMEEVPAAECQHCGRSVGAMYGTKAALTVWEVRGESPPAAGNNGDNDRRLVQFGAGDPPVFDDDDANDNQDGLGMTDSRFPSRSEWTQPSPDIRQDVEAVEYIEDLFPETSLANIETWRVDGHIYCPKVDDDWFDWTVETAVAEYEDVDQALSFAGEMRHVIRAYQSELRLYDAIEPRFDAADDQDGRVMTDGGTPYRIDPTPADRPVIPENPAKAASIDDIVRGDRVTRQDGTIVGHVIGTRKWTHTHYGQLYSVEYVTADGEETRTLTDSIDQYPVCCGCGDIVLQNAGGGVPSSHDDGCRNGGE